MKKHPDTNTYMQDVFPEWYWKKGLHDAHIIEITTQEFNYDPVMHASNYLEMSIDASLALFDTTVKAIKFFNCKVMTPELQIKDMWWVRDKLYSLGEKYMLEIDLMSSKSQYRFILRFDYCKVER
mgnify:FL=1